MDGKKKYKKLSKGEKLKFAFAFALAHHPKLLLLDEPGANFDQTFREEFHHILREFTADGTKSVILSTHITSDVDRLRTICCCLRKADNCCMEISSRSVMHTGWWQASVMR